MDLTTILQIGGLAGTILSMFMMLYVFVALRRTKDEAYEYAADLVEKFHAFYVGEKADLAESLPKLIGGMISAPIFSQMGKKSGVSRQLKALEGDMITMGVDKATGIPGSGAIVAELAKKHPIIMQLAPMFMKGRAQGHPDAVRTVSGDGVGYGQ